MAQTASTQPKRRSALGRESKLLSRWLMAREFAPKGTTFQGGNAANGRLAIIRRAACRAPLNLLDDFVMSHEIHAEAKRRSASVGSRRKLADFTEKEIVSMPREQFLGLLSPLTRRHLRAAWAASDLAKKRRR